MEEEVNILDRFLCKDADGNAVTFMDRLIKEAVSAQENALPRRSGLRVGSSVIAIEPGTKPSTISFFSAGNVETLWQRSHHGEENAIMNAISYGRTNVLAVCIAAERKLFTPCGGCMDLIFEFGGSDCAVVHYNPLTKEVSRFIARQLMPSYPTRN